MTKSEDKFKKMKEAVRSLNDAAAKSEATVTVLTEQMQESFGCDNLESAEEKLAELQRRYTEAESKYQHDMDKFEENYGELLDQS